LSHALFLALSQLVNGPPAEAVTHVALPKPSGTVTVQVILHFLTLVSFPIETEWMNKQANIKAKSNLREYFIF
jgi:hypothetical protein